MADLKKFEIWFVTGGQNLYGQEVIKKISKDSRQIVDSFNESSKVPCKVVFKPVVKTPGEIYNICLRANESEKCAGLIMWMHTFSPAKMWISGLKILQKPFTHLHTQFNRDIPWGSMDMDFMNLNQSAHGGREFGHICTRMGKNRKVIVGHWKDEKVLEKLDIWMRAACAWNDWQGMQVARFGDNMRDVSVTEGDKVEAQRQFGYSVNGYGLGDLVSYVDNVSDPQIDRLLEKYKSRYKISIEETQINSVRESLRIEEGMRAFLEEGGFRAFTTTFENLHGLKQLPGLAAQHLMAEGYGFGAEGDWKTAALVRAMKVMSSGLEGGTSFMEDYTYHIEPGNMKVLGAHMLEVCPSIAENRPSLEVHPLGIGGKADPSRLVFNAPKGEGINVSIMDMGKRFRMLVNPCKVVSPDKGLKKLPVARVVWQPLPDLRTAAQAWILAGGAHHTGFSMALTKEHITDFAEIAGIEHLVIDENTTIPDFKKEMRTNEVYYTFAGRLI